MIVKSTCLLCNRELENVAGEYQLHPEVDDCLVKYTDEFGIALDDEPTEQLENNRHQDIDLKIFPFVEDVLIEIFNKYNLKRLGGISTGTGWSKFSLFQRCPRAFQLRYLEKVEPFLPIEATALAVGSLIHVFAAIYYTRMIEPDYPLTPNLMMEECLKLANPDVVNEAWRVFYQYALYYQHEVIQPLAIEYNLADPRTNESCRYDLIAFFPEKVSDRLAGTYIVEMKSSARFDQDTLDGWSQDGEILGQVMLWKRLGLDNRFGKLRGVIVNILGKQKEPQFHRTTVGPESWLTAQHESDLKRWEGLIQLSSSMNQFPRARAGCIGRWGRCNFYDRCSTEKDE